jgi:hypothetical protein
VLATVFLLAKAWVIGYLLALLGVGLGLAVVVRPSRRKQEKRRSL